MKALGRTLRPFVIYTVEFACKWSSQVRSRNMAGRLGEGLDHLPLALVDPRGTKIVLKCKEYSLEGGSPPSSPVSSGSLGLSTLNVCDVRDIPIVSAILAHRQPFGFLTA